MLFCFYFVLPHIEIWTDTIFIATVVNCLLSRSRSRDIWQNWRIKLILTESNTGTCVITLDYILFVFDLSAWVINSMYVICWCETKQITVQYLTCILFHSVKSLWKGIKENVEKQIISIGISFIDIANDKYCEMHMDFFDECYWFMD